MVGSLILLFITGLIMTANTQCTALPTSIDYMVTGIMQLGNPSQSFAKDDYNVVFSGSQKLGTYAQIFHAFAIIGLQTPSGQNFYSVSVSDVYLSNANTVMKVVMDYYNVNRNFKTQWSRVKLSYILVSPQFQGIGTGGYEASSYVWATSIQVSPPLNNVAGDANPIFSHPNTVTGACGYYGSFPPVFGTNCPADAKIIYHYYIMGFKYDSTSDSVYEFRASIKGGAGNSVNQNDFSAVIAPSVVPNGPKFTIQNFSGNLKKIKIGAVVTVLRDYLTYPSQPTSLQKFKYSGIYQPLTTFNRLVVVAKTSSKNLNQFDIGYNKYKVFGFSSISLKPNNFEIDLSLQVRDLYSLILNTQNSLSSVQVSADIFTTDTDVSTCTSTLTQRTEVKSQQYSALPGIISGRQTLNKIPSSNGIINDASYQYVFDVNAYDIGTDSDSIAMTVQLVYDNLIPGRSYVIQTGFNQLNPSDLPSGWSFKYSLSVDNIVVFTGTIIADGAQNDKINKLSRTLPSTTSTITLTIVFNRNPSQNIHFQINCALFQVNNVYDPISQCCSEKCPANTGLNLNTNPFTCVKCNEANGQYYNSTTNQCQCNSGYYLVSTASQICSQCPTKLCATCSQSSPDWCTTCVVGAQISMFGTCNCQNGLVQENGRCSPCNYKCLSCSLSSSCNGCSDPKRDILKGCNCTQGYYDNLQPQCITCNSSCKACLSSNVCTLCHQNKFKQLSNGQCLCVQGYYSVVDNQGNIQCEKCSSQCDSCSGNSWTCTLCNSTKNKFPGYDNSGHLTCICAAGYSLDSEGSCIQTDCTNDPYCSQCQSSNGLKICLACKTSLNRILDTNNYKCVCRQSYYQSSNGVCVGCPIACSTCSNSSYCKSCVAGATFSTNNLCQCRTGTFYTQTPTRYCKGCSQNCQTCNGNGTCLNCQSNYQKTVEGLCICGTGRFINEQGQCSTCSPECQTCQKVTKCLSCRSGYVLQQNACVTRCSLGYYRSGSECLSCPSGCTLCTQSNTCQVCQNGLNLYQGKCYQNCPSGTVLQTTTWRCVPCNYPCRTCAVHPSKCTSCQNDAGALIQGSCVAKCPSGSYASAGLCQYCDFQCATCLGSPRLCTSCPQGKYLSNGACFNHCPQFNSLGQCVTSCPKSFYVSSSSSCTACPSICSECSSATQCTICSSTYYSYLGQCLSQCPASTYPTNSKQCISCDSSCKSCVNSAYNCTQCVSGYILTNQRTCMKDNTILCGSHQFLNSTSQICQQCSNQCQTCFSLNTCLSCYDNAIPVNGKCNLCPVNCNQCSIITQCIQCNFGYYLHSKQCVASCPYPLSANNGQCRCSSGIFFQNKCVSSCSSGYTAISSKCEKCDSNCLQCSQKIEYCVSCVSGYQLNVGSKKCQKMNQITCPFGQYQQQGKCFRYCQNNLVYQNGLCYYTCLSSYINNGQGGCVLRNGQPNQPTKCLSAQYLHNNNCVNQCPQSYYGNSSSLECQKCQQQNCRLCQTSSICNYCQPNYKLQQGQCVSIPIQPECQSGFYYNSTYSTCFPCQQPCIICSVINVCMSCSTGHALLLGQCVQQFINTCKDGFYKDSSNNCQSCPSKCSTCTSTTSCQTCASGYQITPSHTCNPIQSDRPLTQLTNIKVQASYRRQNSVIVSVLLPTIPSSLSLSQQNQFFNIKQSNLMNTISTVNQWQGQLNPNIIFVSVNFNSIQGSSFLFLSVNNNAVGQAYAAMGYSINQKAYKAVSVYQTMQQAPSSIQIPFDSTPTPYIVS